MFSRLKREIGGFNLLEVAIAGFLFATVSVAFLGVWSMQVRSVEKSRHSLVATMLAEEMVEQTMDDGYERTAITDPDEGPEEGEVVMETEMRGPRGDWASIEVNYQTRKLVEVIGDVDEDRLKRVTVTVAWKDSAGGGDITLVTYLAGVF